MTVITDDASTWPDDPRLWPTYAGSAARKDDRRADPVMTTTRPSDGVDAALRRGAETLRIRVDALARAVHTKGNVQAELTACERLIASMRSPERARFREIHSGDACERAGVYLSACHTVAAPMTLGELFGHCRSCGQPCAWKRAEG